MVAADRVTGRSSRPGRSVLAEVLLEVLFSSAVEPVDSRTGLPFQEWVASSLTTNREGAQAHSSANWIKGLLSMTLPTRARPCFPHSQSLSSGNLHTPLSLILDISYLQGGLESPAPLGFGTMGNCSSSFVEKETIRPVRSRIQVQPFLLLKEESGGTGPVALVSCSLEIAPGAFC